MRLLNTFWRAMRWVPRPGRLSNSACVWWGSAVVLGLAGPQVVQAQCVNELQRFAYSGAIDSFTVPSTGSYWLEAAGAEGSNDTRSAVRPGLGALIGGQFSLTAGAQLKILVGQQVTSTAGNGGGGGSFVTDSTNSPLVVAGGGAGSSWGSNPLKHGQAGTAGGAGIGLMSGAGGTAGQGGTTAAPLGAGAGGGLLTNGANGNAGNGGRSFLNGGAGGGSGVAAGGFGGGGGGNGFFTAGGGGGGYSGGGGSTMFSGPLPAGGGGGSFNGGTAPSNQEGLNTGNGYVRICGDAVPPAPAAPSDTVHSVPAGGPWSWGLLATLLAWLGWQARRQSAGGA